MSDQQAPEDRIRALLAEVYKPEGVDLWLRGRKGSFDGRTPLELIAEGEVMRVEGAVQAMIEGVFT